MFKVRLENDFHTDYFIPEGMFVAPLMLCILRTWHLLVGTSIVSIIWFVVKFRLVVLRSNGSMIYCLGPWAIIQRSILSQILNPTAHVHDDTLPWIFGFGGRRR